MPLHRDGKLIFDGGLSPDDVFYQRLKSETEKHDLLFNEFLHLEIKNNVSLCDEYLDPEGKLMLDNLSNESNIVMTHFQAWHNAYYSNQDVVIRK